MLCDILEGWNREGGWEGDFRMEGHMYAYGQFVLMYGKKKKKPSQYVIILPLK